MVEDVWHCLVKSCSLQEELATHIYTFMYIRSLILGDCKWLQKMTPTNSLLKCPAYPILPLASMKATWEPTISENQSLFWCLSVNFMSLVLSIISSAQ